MKKFIVSTIAVIAVLSIALCLNAQPAGGGMGGGMGGAGGGMMGGGAGGGRGNQALRARPDKVARLAAVKELDKQVAALKAAIEKAPAADPNMSKLEGAELTKFMDTYTVESDAINTIQATITSLQRIAGAGGMGRNTGAPTAEILTELSTLAKEEKATKTAARIDALIQQAQQAATRGGGAGGAGGAGAGGGRGARGGA